MDFQIIYFEIIYNYREDVRFFLVVSVDVECESKIDDGAEVNILLYRFIRFRCH